VTDKAAIEYLIGGFLYHRQEMYWTADGEVSPRSTRVGAGLIVSSVVPCIGSVFRYPPTVARA
jgi:hypothetical protein